VKYRVEFVDVADDEVLEIFDWIADESLDAAVRWRKGLDKSVARLSTFPRSCPVAPESRVLGIEVRRLNYGDYRLLYRIVGRVVRVLHVRHGARRRLGEEE